MRYQYLFPFDQVDKGSRIIIYGAGTVGLEFLDQITRLNYCNCAFIADRAYQDFLPIEGVEVCAPEQIKNSEYDKIVVATTKFHSEINELLREMGVAADKIIIKVVEAEDKTSKARDKVFKSPPMTRRLVNAIHRISPHLDFSVDEKSRTEWEWDQNAACWNEYECLRDTLEAFQKPMRILEIGPGLGRSLVFFSKKLGWQDCDIHVYDSDGDSTKYTMNGPRFDDSFCSDISELRRVLAYNNIENVQIHDAKSIALKDVPGPFDLVYGFYNVGYHWSLEYFLDDVLKLMGDKGVAIFTVPNSFKPFPGLQRIPYRTLEKSRADYRKEMLLVLGPAS